jgi:hypothetical protein
MSGGRYGRWTAPERASLPLQQWPAEDRRLWQAACAPGDLLEEHIGARAKYSLITNRNAEKGYGRWLTFLRRTDPACLEDAPANRITAQRNPRRMLIASLACRTAPARSSPAWSNWE